MQNEDERPATKPGCRIQNQVDLVSPHSSAWEQHYHHFAMLIDRLGREFSEPSSTNQSLYTFLTNPYIHKNTSKYFFQCFPPCESHLILTKMHQINSRSMIGSDEKTRQHYVHFYSFKKILPNRTLPIVHKSPGVWTCSQPKESKMSLRPNNRKAVHKKLIKQAESEKKCDWWPNLAGSVFSCRD
jgi:hypothetical protein